MTYLTRDEERKLIDFWGQLNARPEVVITESIVRDVSSKTPAFFFVTSEILTTAGALEFMDELESGEWTFAVVERREFLSRLKEARNWD